MWRLYKAVGAFCAAYFCDQIPHAKRVLAQGFRATVGASTAKTGNSAIVSPKHYRYLRAP
jgi:hypothetical protein